MSSFRSRTQSTSENPSRRSLRCSYSSEHRSQGHAVIQESICNDSDAPRVHSGTKRLSCNHPFFCLASAENSIDTHFWSRQPEIDQKKGFVTTSSQFSLFTSGGNDLYRGPQPLNSKGRSRDCERSIPDLVRLRSSAFWELRQSIADSGEGLIRRMRDYERSRPRHQVYQKAKDAEKRGRKQSARYKRGPQPRLSTLPSDSEDDEILVFSGDYPEHGSYDSTPGKRTRSLDATDIQADRASQQTRWRTSSSSPEARNNVNAHQSQSDDESMSSETSSTTSGWGLPSLSHPTIGYMNPSSTSPPIPSSSMPHDSSFPEIGNDKALNELSFALAHGAGISDYSSVWGYQEQYKAGEVYDHGELWK